MRIKILLADDHQIVRDGLRAILANQPGMQVVAEADDGRSAVSIAQQTQPDVVIMDIAMPGLNGIDATAQITRDNGRIKVIALSAHRDQSFAVKMLEVGASAYLSKHASADELLRAIGAVYRGRKYLSPEITGVVIEGWVNGNNGKNGTKHSNPSGLGGRERAVLQLLAEGKTSKQIGADLYISAKTVEAHRRNIMKKLGIHTVAGLTKYAVREGLTSVNG